MSDQTDVELEYLAARGWTISKTNEWPDHEWTFVHENYYGAPDRNNHLCGTGPTMLDCIEQISELDNELEWD